MIFVFVILFVLLGVIGYILYIKLKIFFGVLKYSKKILKENWKDV